jgi:hypothetical protein
MYEMEGPRPVPPRQRADNSAATPQDPPPVPGTRSKRQSPSPCRVPGVSPEAVPVSSGRAVLLPPDLRHKTPAPPI